jgi:hypothetical protein
VIGATKGLLIVFDHQKGVTEIAGGGEEVEQAGVVGRVKADAGLIQDIEHSGEAAAELGGKTGAAGFPAGESIHGAVEGEVTESEFFQEGEAMDGCLAQRIESVGGGPGGSGKFLKKLPGGGDGELAEGGDVVTAAGRAAEGHEKGVGVKATATTAGAGARAEKAPNAVARCLAGGFRHPAIQFREDALEWFFLPNQAAGLGGLEGDGFSLGAAQEEFPGG